MEASRIGEAVDGVAAGSRTWPLSWGWQIELFRRGVERGVFRIHSTSLRMLLVIKTTMTTRVTTTIAGLLYVCAPCAPLGWP